MRARAHRTVYNKLIRDRIPEVMQERGVRFSIRRLGPQQFRRALLRKLVEEALEVEHAATPVQRIAELADVQDVIRAIQGAFRISDAELETARRRAGKRKGTFRERLLLQWTEEDVSKSKP